MGTDIHMAVERRDPTTGKWYVVPPTGALQEAARKEYARWLDPQGRDAQMRAWAEGRVRQNWYDDRNYEAFAILANVRNGRGFAGTVTGDGFNPIAQPRGLPLDLSDELRTPENYELMRESGFPDVPPDPPERDDDDGEPRGFWLGCHDGSYLTLRELQEYDWTQVTALAGVISWPEYVKRVRAGETSSPRAYSGGVGCQGCVTLDERADDVREHLLTRDGTEVNASGLAAAAARQSEVDVEGELEEWAARKLYIRVWWEETYAESAGRFYSEVMPQLATIDPDPDNVRIVFGFDS